MAPRPDAREGGPRARPRHGQAALRLVKPFDADALASAVREATASACAPRRHHLASELRESLPQDLPQRAVSLEQQHARLGTVFHPLTVDSGGPFANFRPVAHGAFRNPCRRAP
jgi:hypothetical protein